MFGFMSISFGEPASRESYLRRKDEMNEAKMAKAEAYYDDLLEEKRNLCLELTDIITAATSMLDVIGVDEAGRQMYQRIINDRNGRRDGGRRFRKGE